MVLFQPWLHKKGSTERGDTWANLAIRLGTCDKLTFRVTQRSLRDRYLLLERRYKTKVREEEKSTGISPKPTELDQLMEEIVGLFEEAEEGEESKKRKAEEEATQIQEMRKVSLESFKETRERNHTEKPKKKRTSGADAIPFIKKVQLDGKQKETELELKKQEMDLKKEEMEWKRNVREKELELRKKEHEERVSQQESASKLQEQQQMHNMNMTIF
jgi:hypothetical protein